MAMNVGMCHFLDLKWCKYKSLLAYSNNNNNNFKKKGKKEKKQPQLATVNTHCSAALGFNYVGFFFPP